MPVNIEKVGNQIAALRKLKKLTQNDLGERLNISFQAVSKWERGETLPDTAILPDLANILETTVDNILGGGEKALNFKGKMSVKDIREGINCFERMGMLLGKQNIIYRFAVEGVNERMNADIEAMLADEYLKECLITEAILNSMKSGYYFDMSDVRNNFKHEKWYNIICEYAKKHDIF